MEAAHRHETITDRTGTAYAELTALVVDDDRHVRSYLRMLLRGLGLVTVAEAVDATEALGLLRKLRPSIVLLDVDLPGVSLAEAMQPLRAWDPDVAVIVVTSRIDPDFMAAMDALDVLGHIPIHVLREEIAQRISGALDRLRPRVATPCRMIA